MIDAVVPNCPTATQELAEVQEIPDSAAEPGGELTRFQVVPLRCSAMAAPVVLLVPTAMHEVTDGQDTAVRNQLFAPGGAGAFCCSQLAAAGCAIVSSAGSASAATATRRLTDMSQLP